MNEAQVREMMQQQQVQLEQRLQSERADMQAQVAAQVASQIEAAQTRAMLAEQEARLVREEQARVQHLLEAAVTARGNSGGGPLHTTEEMSELRSVVDVRMLDKLEHFDGQDAHWESWLTGFEALTGLIGLNELMEISGQTSVTMADTQLAQLGGDEVRLKAKALWYLLTQACRGKARNLVKKAEKFNGAHAWKILLDEYRPRMAGRFNAMLMGLLRPEWDDSTPFLDQLAAWEVDCLEYVIQSGQPLTDSTKIAVVTSNCPASAQWVVRMASLQQSDEYRGFKLQIELYYKQTLAFSASGGQMSAAVPMDVGGIGKGKGKDTYGRQPSAGTVCKICKKTGHLAKDCWWRDNALPKSGAGFGKGKDSDPKGKGKGKKGEPPRQPSKPPPPKFEGKCNWCKKPGHKAADCRAKAAGQPRAGGISDTASEAPSLSSTAPSSATTLARKNAGGVGGISAEPVAYVLGLSEKDKDKSVGGVTVPNRDIKDGEWLWASLDSGSDVHTTPPQVDPCGSLRPSLQRLEDIQGGNMQAAGGKLISFEALDESGEAIPFITESVVSKTKKFVLSTGKMDIAGFKTVFDGADSYVEARATKQRLPVQLIGNTYYLKIRVQASPPQCGGLEDPLVYDGTPHPNAASSTQQPANMEIVPSGASAPSVAPAASSVESNSQLALVSDPGSSVAAAASGTQPAVLSKGAPVAKMKARLKELKCAIYGTKEQLHARLMLAEARKAVEDKTLVELERRHQQLAEGSLGREAAVLPVPQMPSEEEVKTHNLTHLPPQRWCITCQLARSNDAPHELVPVDHQEKPRVETDFMYMKTDGTISEILADGEPPTNEWCTILTAVDKDSGCKLSLVIPGKAVADDYGQKSLADFLRRLGHREVQILRDQEPALIALVNGTVAECNSMNILVDPRDAPRYSHASLGAMGRAQQTIQKQIRALRTDVHVRYGIWLSTDRPAWPWMVRHAAWLVDRFAVKANGRTCYEDAFGTSYRGPILQMLEACLFRRSKSDSGAMTRGRRAQKADNQWDRGLWLGKAHVSNEMILGTEQGTEMARAVKRLPEHLQVDLELLDKMVGTPWDPKLTAPKGRPKKSPPVQAVPVPAIADSVGGGARPAVQGEPQSEGAQVDEQTVPEGTMKQDADVVTAPMGVDVPPQPSQGGLGKRKLAVQWDAALDNPEDNPLKRKAEGEESAMVGGLVTMTSMDDEGLGADLEDWDEDDDEEDWYEDDEIDVDEKLIEQARQEELDNWDRFGVGTLIGRSDAAKSGYKHLQTRWVNAKRGDSWRSRCVGKEFKAMAPARRGLFTSASSTSTARLIDLFGANGDIYSMIGDALNAYLQIPEEELVTIDIPEEMKPRLHLKGLETDGMVLKLNKKLYGRRDASVCFGDFVAAVLVKEGAERCKAQPSLYFVKTTGAKCEVHQDDVHACCRTYHGMVQLRDLISKHLLMKWSEIMGTEGVYDHLKCRRIKTKEGIYLVPADKHTDKILAHLKMEDCKPAPTPITVCRKRDDELVDPLPADRQKTFRSCVGVGRFLRQFKPETGFAVKELSHRLKEAYPADELRLKRYARYLAGSREKCIFFPRREGLTGPIVATSDTDWATDDISRKSTASGCIQVSECLLLDFCLSQNVVADSSGMAEYYGGCGVVAEALHIQSILEFFDHWFAIKWRSDSSVARAVSERMGVGRIKHLEVKSLWLQEKVKENAVLPDRVETQHNCADLNTKVHPVARFQYLMGLMGIVDKPARVGEVKKTAKAGGITDKKTLALAVALGDLMQRGSSQELSVAAVEQSLSVDVAASSYWSFTTLLKLAALTMLVVFLVGMGCGWKLRGWLYQPKKKFPSVASAASGGSRKRSKGVDKSTQSQVRYTWYNQQPRFTPLGDYGHGCWDG